MMTGGGESGPIFLLGMMGAGKSSVGRELAARLGAVFVDLDRRIELMFASSIAEMFAHGEAYFRACERAALLTLLDEPGLGAGAGPVVVATGGGVVVDPDNLEAMAAAGSLVYLEVEVETLAARLSSEAQRGPRPLLDAEGPLVPRLAEVLAEREGSYRRAAIVVDARDAPEAVARRCLEALSRTRARE